MATIKSYTTIEQSRKLAKILPLKSADMHFINDKHAGCVPYFEMINDSNPWSKGLKIYPCWSLACLLKVMPFWYDIHPVKNGVSIKCDYGKEEIVISDNPVDACYEMILKLHERKVLL